MGDIQGIEMTPAVNDSFVPTAIIVHATYVLPELVLGSAHLVAERRLVFSNSHEATADTEAI